MFKKSPNPRVFGVPIGVSFPEALVAGILERCANKPPEFIARIDLYVSTRRMQRRVLELFDSRQAMLLPRIRLISEIDSAEIRNQVPKATSKLRTHIELGKLIANLLQLQPTMAAKSAVFDLAESLGNLMAEMHSEGVTANTISALDVSDSSGHWARALEFVKLIKRYNEEFEQQEPSADGRQRQIVDLLIQEWGITPPDHPIIIAGSTGSRGATHLLMSAVAQMPQGAVVVPGFDFDLPDQVWAKMQDTLTNSDHPQFRYSALMNSLSLLRNEIQKWDDTPPMSPQQNALVSLSLRPAPITDQWISDGPELGDLVDATQNLSLIEAESTRHEALAIAIKLRECAELGIKAALISPDRVLTRKVTAALDRWGIMPDDSAGLPLVLSAPGRFILHTAELFDQTLTFEALLTLLKHPITSSAPKMRGDHLRWTRDFELYTRRKGQPFPTQQSLIDWAVTGKDDGRQQWAKWLGDLVCDLEQTPVRPLRAHLDSHLFLMERLSAGYKQSGAGVLWEKAAGEAADAAIKSLVDVSESAGSYSCFDYKNLVRHVLNSGEVHNPVMTHPNIMIWGTLEARVQGADLVILAGLNEGVWPKTPEPDPWMNRKMRLDAGLLLPERQIGLSAHDFQQAISTKQVILSRSLRDMDTPTIPSRWVLRLTNLVAGLESQNGETALAKMRRRGKRLLDMALAIEDIPEIASPAHRPSPRPPTEARPKRLSVTEIKTLIRDPYAIYAKSVLRLRKLDPVRQSPDARLAGIVIHLVFEKFMANYQGANHKDAKRLLKEIASEVIHQEVYWPLSRRLLTAKIDRVADWFLTTEKDRTTRAKEIMTEVRGGIDIGTTGVSLVAKADRIDVTNEQAAFVYDYKTGTPPSKPEQIHFDKQLLITAAMVERGAFEKCPPMPVLGAEYIGLGAKPAIIPAPLLETSTEQTWLELDQLITQYNSDDQGFTARRAMNKQRISGDYDHLARYGEWDDSDVPVCEDLE